MLLLPSVNDSRSNMVFSKIRPWNDDDERENNNNTVKNDILRTPPRCTLGCAKILILLSISFVSFSMRSFFFLASAICKYASRPSDFHEIFTCSSYAPFIQMQQQLLYKTNVSVDLLFATKKKEKKIFHFIPYFISQKNLPFVVVSNNLTMCVGCEL